MTIESEAAGADLGTDSTWRVTMWREIRWVEDLLSRSPDPESPEHRAVEDYVLSARTAFLRKRKGWSRFKAWWTGADIEAAWLSVHAAKQALFMVAAEDDVRAQIPLLRSKLSRHLKKQDPDRTAYEKWLDEQAKPSSKIDRSSLKMIRSTVDAVSDQRFATLRAFRNTLYGAAAGLLVILTVLVFDPPSDPFLPICAPPSSTSADASAKERAREQTEEAASESCPRVWQIELVGALGGALAAVTALSRIRISTGPYGVRIAQAVLKVPAGAAFGLVGAMLMQSEAIDALEPQKLPALFAYVVIFGYSQQTITRLIDQKAKSLGSETASEGNGE